MADYFDYMDDNGYFDQEDLELARHNAYHDMMVAQARSIRLPGDPIMTRSQRKKLDRDFTRAMAAYDTLSHWPDSRIHYRSGGHNPYDYDYDMMAAEHSIRLRDEAWKTYLVSSHGW